MLLSHGAAVAFLGLSKLIVTSFVAIALGVLPQRNTKQFLAAVEHLCREAIVAASKKPYGDAWLVTLAFAWDVGMGRRSSSVDRHAP